MVTFNPTSPVVTPPATSTKSTTRQVFPSAAADKRESSQHDRRFKFDRRRRRGALRVMDRRLGAERRRSSIDVSV